MRGELTQASNRRLAGKAIALNPASPWLQREQTFREKVSLKIHQDVVLTTDTTLVTGPGNESKHAHTFHTKIHLTACDFLVE